MQVSENVQQFYIGGEWVSPSTSDLLPVVNPATEQPIASIALGGTADIDAAVAAAKAAFPDFSATPVEERIALLNRIVELLGARSEELAATISAEMGAPTRLAKAAQAPSGLAHFATTAALLAAYEFEEQVGSSLVVKEPVGVVGMITPWNWPINQIACKVAPALATGCTMVLKPSEQSPLSGIVFTEIMHEAGVPAGVYNMLNGDGPGVGSQLSVHKHVDMVSFTGSTRAG
ncbi:MAG: aldehyde dehydrogenase family protein, partial [Actinomycetota bacterium]